MKQNTLFALTKSYVASKMAASGEGLVRISSGTEGAQ